METIGITATKKVCVVILCILLLQVLANRLAQAAEDQKILEVSPQLLLVIKAPAGKTFSKDWSVTFTEPKAKPTTVAPDFISHDGQTLAVTIPDQSNSGIVNVTKDKDTIQIKFTRPEKPIGKMAWFPFIFFIGFLMLIGCFLYKASTKGQWSLSQALSELITRKFIAKDGNGNTLYKVDANKQITDVMTFERSEYTSSASRLIACIGLFAFIALIIQILVIAAYAGKFPEMKDFYGVLGTQLAAFAPYMANKASGAFGGT